MIIFTGIPETTYNLSPKPLPLEEVIGGGDSDFHTAITFLNHTMAIPAITN